MEAFSISRNSRHIVWSPNSENGLGTTRDHTFPTLYEGESKKPVDWTYPISLFWCFLHGLFRYNRQAMNPIYKRIIIKLSGEALADSKDGSIFDREKLERIANVVKEIHEAGVEIGIVVGAGNIWRGRMADKIGIEQAQADYMGMLGTIMNGMAIQNALELKGLSTRVMSAINVPQCCEPYIRRKAMSHLSEGRIVIFAGGTGNPYFTTDSCATLRALEVKADAILMAKNGVDGVFDSDPRKNPNAKLLTDLTYHEVVERKLAVMDLTAVAMLEGKDVVVRVFNMDHPSSFLQVLSGETIGTVLHKDR